MDVIKVGTKAPDFILEDGFGKVVKLSDYRGQQVLLSWHPLAWTSVCTDQMRALEAHYEEFAAKNTVVKNQVRIPTFITRFPHFYQGEIPTFITASQPQSILVVLSSCHLPICGRILSH